MSSTHRLAAESQEPADRREAPALRGRRHGEDRIHLLIRDPRSVFVAWEIGETTSRAGADRARDADAPVRYQLRVDRRERPGDAGSTVATYDLPDALGGEGWYATLPRAGGECRASIGLDLPGGFHVLLATGWGALPPETPCAEEGVWDAGELEGRELDRYFGGVASVPGSRRPTPEFAGGARPETAGHPGEREV